MHAIGSLDKMPSKASKQLSWEELIRLAKLPPPAPPTWQPMPMGELIRLAKLTPPAPPAMPSMPMLPPKKLRVVSWGIGRLEIWVIWGRKNRPSSFEHYWVGRIIKKPTLPTLVC